MSPDNLNHDFEKKSERLEIRLGYSKKQAFNQACEDQGDTPSNALRRFINSYIARADQDAFKDGLRALGRMWRRRWMPMMAGTMALMAGAFFAYGAMKPAIIDGPVMTASVDDFPPIDYVLFAVYDKNANGVLDLGEVTDNDEHLHRVLNLDGEAGIAPSEFYARGTMAWHFAKKNSVKTGHNDDGPTATMVQDGETHVVAFDLTNVPQPVFGVRPISKTVRDINETAGKRFFGLISYRIKSEEKHSEPIDRTVAWERGQSSPALSFSSHDFRERRVDPS